jgi:predicted TIM-barrel fold metal-dependent hydrolase
MKRRHFLSTAGSALAGAVAVGSSASPKAQNAPAKKFRVVDGHMHIFNTALRGKNGIPKSKSSWPPPASVEDTLKLMDEGGISKGLLKAYSFEDIALDVGGRDSPVILKQIVNNQYVYESWRAHQDHFWWFQLSPGPIREGYLEFLESCIQRGASGLIAFPLFNGLLFDHPTYISVYELCRRHKKALMFEDWYFHHISEPHYTIQYETRERQKWAGTFKSFSEYSRAVLDPVIKEFSDVPICVNHCANPNAAADYGDIFDWLNRHPNLYCDISTVPDYSPTFIESLVKAVGAQKVIYGSDSPSSPIPIGRRWRVVADDCHSLGDEEKQMILAENVERYVSYQMPLTRA